MSRRHPVKVRRDVDDVAIEVWHELEKASYDGLSIPELGVKLPHFSLGQIRNGIERINHVMQQTRSQPLIGQAIRGRSYVYKFPREVGDYQLFTVRRMREVLTRAATEVARAEAAILRWPDDVAPYVPKQLSRITEDIEEIIVDLRYMGGEHDEG